jgi:hypothetical protein
MLSYTRPLPSMLIMIPSASKSPVKLRDVN